jgi:hypothetical protein
LRRVETLAAVDVVVAGDPLLEVNAVFALKLVVLGGTIDDRSGTAVIVSLSSLIGKPTCLPSAY